MLRNQKTIKKTTISVIVPVYNVEEYLEACVDSILSQTYKQLEIILVDDGSTDNSGIICDKLMTSDERIKVIHKKNGGLASARNAGLDICTGDYIGFVDSDDWIEKDMYEKLLDQCMTTNSDITCCGRILWFGESYKKELYTLDSPEIWNAKEAIGRLLIWDAVDSSACDKLFDKSLFLYCRFPEGRLHEDIFVMYKIFFEANRISHIGLPKYNYRQRVGGITRNKYTSKKLDMLDAIDEIDLFIRNIYPDYIERLNAFATVNTNVVLYPFRNNKNYYQLYKEDNDRINKYLIHYGKKAIRNNYLNAREKVKYYLARIHMTNLYIAIKESYKKSIAR